MNLPICAFAVPRCLVAATSLSQVGFT